MCQKPARLAIHWMEELAPVLANSRRTLFSLHVDHLGWSTMLENGKWAPTF
jgi:hypothetical protein